MAVSSTYKNQRGSRYLDDEMQFTGGMMYTDSPLDPPYLKTIVNFDYNDMTGSLRTRKGLKQLNDYILADVESGITLSVNLTDEDTLLDPPAKEYTMDFDKPKILGAYDVIVTHVSMTGAAEMNTKPDGSQQTINHYALGRDFVTKCILIAQPVKASWRDPTYAGAVTIQALLENPESPGMFELATFGSFRYPEEFKNKPDRMYGIYREESYSSVYNESGKYFTINLDVTNALSTLQNELFFTGTQIVGGKEDPMAPEWSVIQVPVLGKISFFMNQGKFVLTTSKVLPLKVSAREAINNGYNMLLKEPFTDFPTTSNTVNSIDGIIPLNPVNNEVLLNMRVGQSVRFKLYYGYSGTETVEVKWEWAPMEANTSAQQWYTMGESTAVAGGLIQIEFKPTLDRFIVRATMTRGTSSDPVAVAILPVTGIVNNQTRSTLKKYQMGTAKGITTWQSRLAVWGILGAENMIFISELNDPTYFPYPNNAHHFDSEVIRIVPYLEHLLVFTSERIYLLEQNPDGIGFKITVVQNRLSLVPEDSKFIQVIKNMVFFKSENYFYMVVPKATSLTGELTIAPISKAIHGLLDKSGWGEGEGSPLAEIVRAVYAPWFVEKENTVVIGLLPGESQWDPDAEYGPRHLECSAKSAGLLYNYVDGNVIRNVFEVNISIYDPTPTGDDGGPSYLEPTVYVFVNYDTVTRAWTLYTTQGNGNEMLPMMQKSTGSAHLVNIFFSKASWGHFVIGSPHVQVLSFEDTLGRDTQSIVSEGFPIDSILLFNNIPFIDTGYRKHSESLKKRYREVQFKVLNLEERPLSFGTSFRVDGVLRRTYQNYVSVQSGDTIIIEQDIHSDFMVELGSDYLLKQDPHTAGSFTHSATPAYLEPDVIDPSWELLNTFELEASMLPRDTAVKIRFPVSGKGYSGKLLLRGFLESPFELLGISWVYRIMNGR